MEELTRRFVRLTWDSPSANSGSEKTHLMTHANHAKKKTHSDLIHPSNPQGSPVVHYLLFFSCMFRPKINEKWAHYKKESRSKNYQQNGPFRHLYRHLKSQCLLVGALEGVGASFW